MEVQKAAGRSGGTASPPGRQAQVLQGLFGAAAWISRLCAGRPWRRAQHCRAPAPRSRSAAAATCSWTGPWVAPVLGRQACLGTAALPDCPTPDALHAGLVTARLPLPCCCRMSSGRAHPCWAGYPGMKCPLWGLADNCPTWCWIMFEGNA